MIRRRGNSWQVDVMVNRKRIRRSAKTNALAKEIENQLIEQNKSYVNAESEECHESTATDEIKLTISINPDTRLSQNDDNLRHENEQQATMHDMLEVTWTRYWQFNKDGVGSRRISQNVLNELAWVQLRPTQITRKMLIKLIDFYRDKGNAPATVNRKIVAITKLLGTAVEEGIINSKPSIKLLKEHNARTRYLSVDEEEKILFWLCELGYDDAWHLTRFLIDTGCRLGEAISIDETCIKHSDRVIHLTNTKNYESRYVPLTDRAYESLLKWRGLTGAGFYNKFKEACSYAEIGSDVSPHTLRHTCASRMVQSGIAMPILTEWLGHKSIRMTERYAHLNLDNLKSARDVINGLLSKR